MKKIVFIVLCIALAFNLIGCSSTGTSAATEEGGISSEKIVIRYPNTPWYDLVYIADEKGFFDDVGIEIQYAGQVPAAQLVPSVVSRSIDFGLRHTPLVVMARAQGAPLKIVAAGTETLVDYPHMRYIVKKDSGIETIEDLVGKKIAINSFGACSEFVTKEFLTQNQIEGEVDFVVLPDAQQQQALEQGLIDVAIVHAPYSKKALTNDALEELINDYALEEGISGMCPYFTHEDFIKENPEAVEGFVAAVGRAAEWARENEEEAKKIIAVRLGIAFEEVEAWAYYENQLIQEEAAQWWIDFLEKEGEIEEGLVQVTDLYTNEFNPY